MVEIIMMNMMILVAMTMIVVFSFRLIFIVVSVRICLFCHPLCKSFNVFLLTILKIFASYITQPT